MLAAMTAAPSGAFWFSSCSILLVFLVLHSFFLYFTYRLFVGFVVLFEQLCGYNEVESSF